jgi:glycosyltransferase
MVGQFPHPALFVRKEVYEKAGLYKDDFKIAADYEFFLRILKKNQFNLKYIPQVFVKCMPVVHRGVA